MFGIRPISFLRFNPFLRPGIPFPWLGALVFVILFLRTVAAEQSPWIEIHSAHYTVITDGGEKRGREVALRFEQMRAIFGSLLMKNRLNETLPLTILAFKNDRNYYQTAPLKQGEPIDTNGFFLPGEDQNFIVLNLFEPEPWRAVAHEFAHMLMNSNYPPVEGWFDEGFAEYFGSIRVDDRKYEIGEDPELQPLYKEDLLQNQQEQNPPRSLTELLSGQVWLSLADLLTIKHDVSNYIEGTHHTLFYAQSWMMVHYLINRKKLPETGAYFDLVENQHVPVEQAIQKAYGVSPAEFDQAVKDYFHSLTQLFVALDASKQQPSAGQSQPQLLQPYEFPVPVGPNENEVTSKALTENDARAIVGEVKIRIPERRDAGMNELKTLATVAEETPAKPFAKWIPKKAEKGDREEGPLVSAVGNEIAHRALAWDAIERADFDAASTELNDAAALNPHDMWIRYYVSVLKYRISLAKHMEISGLPNEMQDLRAVLEWYPQFAEAYDMLAVARMQGGGQAAALQAEHDAIQLSPRDQRYQLHLAEIYMSDRKWDAARALLERLKSSGNAQIATAAREQLERIFAERKYGITGASVAPTAKLEPQKSPFDVLEEDAAKRAAAEKSSQSGGPDSFADKRPAKFVQGRLLSVDCSQAPAAILMVNAEGRLLKLRTQDYKSMLLIGADSFSCDWSDRSVSVNYKPGGLSDGDLVSVEVH
jgi:hypothetical protein